MSQLLNAVQVKGSAETPAAGVKIGDLVFAHTTTMRDFAGTVYTGSVNPAFIAGLLLGWFKALFLVMRGWATFQTLLLEPPFTKCTAR